MNSQIRYWTHPDRRAWFGTAAILALLAGAAVFGASTSQAAERQSWEIGCAWREVTPGPGDALRNYNCTRQRDCQQMANAKGQMMMGLGCFFVMPEAGSSRPAQRQ
jgi:hypothetical protein